MKYTIPLFFCFIACTAAFCQSGIDIENLYQLRVHRPDSSAVKNHLKYIKVYSGKGKSAPGLLSAKYFDTCGYLTRLVKIDNVFLHDTCFIQVNRTKKGQVIVTTSINRKALESIKSNDNEWVKYKKYMSLSTCKNKYFSLENVYYVHPDSTFGIVTYADGARIDSSSDRDYLAGLDPITEDDMPKPDSVYHGDTLVISKLELNGSQKIIASRFILKGYNELVKAQVLEFRNDTLLYYRYNTWVYDHKRRVVLYREIHDTTIFVTESTQYNDLTGSKIISIDAYPSNNQIDKVFVYDSANRLIEAVKYVNDYSVKLSNFIRIKYSSTYGYHNNGLPRQESSYANGNLREAIWYRYGYYPLTTPAPQKTSYR
jgi:hypothetical protein